ncbi:glutathione S-transferase family protein [Brevundimonas sp. 2R-24]|uniref:Glutathione S-transferase family protein n=1 Tax=Peiella sedimenti TaxID=3061083 RepID=A0ABT8SKZ8_9CAUL|nr:glutathione S-transferase family protein [Caulobacteraceae bacterium XZ-24]
MARLTLYGDPKSGNCLKVKWVLDLLSRPYDWVDVDVTRGEARTPRMLAINPAGQVPCVVLEDGRALAQSGAILLHLAEDSHLIPDDAYDRARMLEWMFWEQYSHEPYIAVRRFQRAFLNRPDAEIDPKLYERGSAALERLEAALQAGPYLVGDRISLADIALVAYTRVADEGGFDLAKYPCVAAWIVKVEADLGIGS